MQSGTLAVGAVLGLALVTSGCTVFTKPADIPVSSERAGNVGTIATSASRRVVVVNNREVVVNGTAVRSDSVYCAEPSPDVTENVASNLAAAVAAGAELAKAPTVEGRGQLQATINDVATRVSQSLTRRTQGAQLWRDGLYSLCQAHANNAINQQEYSARFSELLKEAGRLIEVELKLPPSTAAPVTSR